MKLLFDNNLSPRLILALQDIYNDCSHVVRHHLETASDEEVWQFAHQNGYCLVTKDADFNDLLMNKGFPPKIIWIRKGNCTTQTIMALLKDQHDIIMTFLMDESIGIIELQ
jgi:predicted nuclease of predicted toxin-antitoxin system